MAIDIGAGAANYDDTAGTKCTVIDKTNPANETGTISNFQIWANTDNTGVKVGTFYGSGTSYTYRDYETIGNVSSGSVIPITGKDCSCESGDLIGYYAATGLIEYSPNGGSGVLYVTGDKFGAGATTYTAASATGRIGLYGTSAPLGIKTIDGVAVVSIKTINGLVLSSIKTITGL